MKVVVHVQFFKSFKKCFRPKWHPHELWYAFKCWAWKRYSTIKARYLGHKWCDRSTLLPHMMFEILSQFIERECSPGIVEWHGEEGHKITVDGKEKFVRDEMQELYDWWNNDYIKGYPAKENAIWEEIHAIDVAHKLSDFVPCDDGSNTVEWNPQYDTEENKQKAKSLLRSLNDLEDESNKRLNEMMHRLVAVREYMWT